MRIQGEKVHYVCTDLNYLMKIYFSTLCLGLVTILFSSCQKEISSDPILKVTSGDSTLLARYIELDTTLPSGSDTTFQEFYRYDAQKRVTRIYSIYSSAPGDIDILSYFYSGLDTLPNKVVLIWKNGSAPFVDTAFLSYTNGLVSYDSIITYDITNNKFFRTEVATYTASGSNTFIQSRQYLSAAPSPVSRQWSGMVFKTYQNGNIIQQEDTSTFAIIFTNRQYTQVSYDNKINPFYRIYTPYPFLRKLKVQKNNTIEETSSDTPSSLYSHYIYSYTYRPDGYPLIVRMHSLLWSYARKGIYLYTQ